MIYAVAVGPCAKRVAIAAVVLVLCAGCDGGHPASAPPTSSSAPVPAETTVHPAVTVTPNRGLVDGQRITVRVTGFGVGTKVWLSECASGGRGATALGCGPQLPAQTLLLTGGDGSGTTTFVAHNLAATKAYDPTELRPCRTECVVVATLGSGDNYAYASITFRTPYPQYVVRAMRHTFEVAHPSEHFKPETTVATLDRASGTLLAVEGVRTPTTDGKGQLIFFFHNDTFVGWDANREAVSVLDLKAARVEDGQITVTYANLGPKDPIIGASLPPVTITYRWDGRRIVANRPPPPGVYDLNNPSAEPVYVKLAS